MDKHPLAKFREDNGLTLADLANRIGVKPAAVSRWENGHRFPRSDALERIRRVTNGAVTANDFVPVEAAQ